jgi:hypothetical protein
LGYSSLSLFHPEEPQQPEHEKVGPTNISQTFLYF